MLNTFDLKSEEKKVEEVDVTFDQKLYGIKLVVPQSAPIKISEIFTCIYYKDYSASLRNLMDDEGKFTTMSKSLIDVPPIVVNILYFDGSN